MVVTNARIVTCDNGRVITNGYIVVEGSTIAEVAEGGYSGGDTDIYNAGGSMVCPGFIDAHCHIGMWEEGIASEGDDGNEETDPCTPHLRSIDAINPMDRAFTEALAYGITTVVTGPGSANPVAGQITALKTAGRVVDRMVIKFPCAMKFALGENPKVVYSEKSQQPATRMAVASIIREQLYKAKRYSEDMLKVEQDEEGDTDPPEYDIKCEALLPLLRREVPAHFHAHRADDICTALRLIREFELDGVIVHGTEGYLVAEELAEAGIPVICGPIICTRGKPELRNLSRGNLAMLHKAGVVTAVNTDAPELPIDMLLTSVAIAAGDEMPHEQALETVTCNAAKVAGIDDRVGSIAVGKDADLLVFDSDPVGLLVKPCKVMVNGRFVSTEFTNCF